MSLGAILSAISTIISTLDTIQSLRDLFAGNSSSAITLIDVQRMVRRETAQLFLTVEIARLQSIRRSFYDVWLPSVARRTTLAPADVAPNGALHGVYQSLGSAVQRVSSGIHALAAVFHSYSDVLHVDDLVCGQATLIELFGLLLHMHSVLSTLNRARVGASSPDDPRLDSDTRSAISYAYNAREVFEWLVPLTWAKRADDIERVQDRYVWIDKDSRPTYYFVFWFADRYAPLRTTPTTSQLGVQPAQYRRSTLDGHGAETWVRSARAEHENRVRGRYATVANEGVQRLMRELERLLRVMNRRLAVQTGGRRPQGTLPGRFPRWGPPRRRPRPAPGGRPQPIGLRGAGATSSVSSQRANFGAYLPDELRMFSQSDSAPYERITSDSIAPFSEFTHTDDLKDTLASRRDSEYDLLNTSDLEGESSKSLRRSSSLPALVSHILADQDGVGTELSLPCSDWELDDEVWTDFQPLEPQPEVIREDNRDENKL